MMHFFHINELLSIIARHTDLAYMVILLVSFLESLAVIGLIVPGTLIMFGIGALVSTGSLDLASVLILAAFGAIAGDGISYWLGYHYKDHLRQIWPFSRYPGLLKKGMAFFESHGGKSVFFGRFVGPVRAVIPVVAGIMGMEKLRFFMINVLSAICWSLFFILPGFFLGTSLAVAGAVSARFAILGFILFAAVWIFLKVCRRVALEISRRGYVWFSAFMNWLASDSEVHWILIPVKRFSSYVFLRRKSDALWQEEELFTFFLILVFFLTCWGFLGVLHGVIRQDPMVLADHAVYNFFQSLRTPWINNLFVVITELGDFFVTISLFFSVLIVLIVKGCRRTAVFWILTVSGAFAIAQLLKYILFLFHPESVYHVMSAGFPSCHTAMGVVLYGFLVIMLTRDVQETLRWKLFATILLISFVISISRLYLGINHFSDVLGGFFIGTSWTVLSGIAWLKKPVEKIPVILLGIVIVSVIALAGGVHISRNYRKDIVFYAARHNIKTVSFTMWSHDGWKNLPAWRFDIAGEKEQPLTLQFTGSLGNLKKLLLSAGWREPESMGLRAISEIFSSHVSIDKFPVLPRLHSGRVDILRLIYCKRRNNTRWVLRLWPSDFRLAKNAKPIFVGTIEVQRFRRFTGLITAVMDTGQYSRPIALVRNTLKKFFNVRKVMRCCKNLRMHETRHDLYWDGSVLLIWR